MKNFKITLPYTLIFIAFSAFLFLTQFLLAQQGIVSLNYKIHFLMFFVTLICILSVSLVFILNKKDVIGFVFLGFVVFKFFAIGYIAMFEPDFKKAIVPYFVLYWLYLAIEVFYVIKLVKKQD
ncbi:hypothetical protein [Chryseobacterium sp. T1]